jgi:hypothetical protein
MKTKFVKPREGYKIPDPQLRDFLPVDGRVVPFDVYWARLLRDGDVVEMEPPGVVAPAEKVKGS